MRMWDFEREGHFRGVKIFGQSDRKLVNLESHVKH